MKLYFVRHGESEANVLRIISNREAPHGLTDNGRRQANALADTLQGISFGRIFSGPVLRARQTAEILAERLEVPYEITEALREYDCGILEGNGDPASWELHQAVFHQWLHEGHYANRIEGGESFHDIQARFQPWIECLVREYATCDEANLLVGHGGIYCCVLPMLLSNVDVTFALAEPIRYTDCIVAERTRDGFLCSRWGSGPCHSRDRHAACRRIQPPDTGTDRLHNR